MPITPYKDWKAKLERAHFSKVQSGKIPVWEMNSNLKSVDVNVPGHGSPKQRRNEARDGPTLKVETSQSKLTLFLALFFQAVVNCNA